MRLKPEFIRLKPKDRLHECPLPIIGLTGGIGSGKSSVAKMLREQGLFIIDADELVHRIYEEQSSLDYLSSLHPEAVGPDGIDFQKLRQAAFSKPNLLKDLESFIYQQLPAFFRCEVEKSQHDFIIYDVPLLFEKKLNELCDLTVCVYCEPEQQLERSLKRDSSDPQTIKAIIQKQMPIKEKANLSDLIINNTNEKEKLGTSILFRCIESTN